MNDVSLKDRIFMENQSIKVRNEIAPKLENYFKKFIGEKVLKDNNTTLVKKIKDDPEYLKIVNESNFQIEPVPGGHVQLNIWVTARYKSISATIKFCFNGGSYETKNYYCCYVEHTIYIAEVEGDTLIKVEHNEPAEKVDYTKQAELIKEYTKKKQELATIKSKINYNLDWYVKYGVS